MHIGTIMMAIGTVVMLMAPLMFGYMWANVRINTKDEKRAREEEKKVISLLIYAELGALVFFVGGSYFKSMVSLQFAVVGITIIIAVMFIFNRILNAPEAEYTINESDTA